MLRGFPQAERLPLKAMRHTSELKKPHRSGLCGDARHGPHKRLFEMSGRASLSHLSQNFSFKSRLPGSWLIWSGRRASCAPYYFCWRTSSSHCFLRRSTAMGYPQSFRTKSFNTNRLLMKSLGGSLLIYWRQCKKTLGRNLSRERLIRTSGEEKEKFGTLSTSQVSLEPAMRGLS